VLKKKLPDGWEWRQLGDLIELKYGKGLREADRNEEGDISVYGSNGPVGRHDVPLLNTAGIIVGRKGSVGAIHKSDGPFWAIDTTYYIEPIKSLDLSYLYYLLKTLNLSSLDKSTSIPGLNRNDVYRKVIPVPPLDTQRKIVAILEKAEVTQRLRAEADALTQQLLQSVFLEMFGDPSIKSTNWPFERLGNVISVTSGHGFKLEEYCDDGIRLLRINNVSFGDIIWEQVAYLPFEYGDKFPHLVLKKDDILMALNRPILGNKLKVGMMDEEDAPAILYQRVGRIDILDEERVNRQYLFHLLRTRYFLSELSARLSGSDQPYINPTAMIKIKIPLPPIAIQNRFAQIAANIQLTYDTGQNSRNQLQTLFQVILDRAFTGELIA